MVFWCLPLSVMQCLCELPESYEAYKKQQYRWHSGPMQLFRLCFMDIIRSKVWKFNMKNTLSINLIKVISKYDNISRNLPA